MKKTDTANRLKEIMRIRNLRQVDIVNLAKPFCEKYNVKLGKNDLSQYISGKVEPRQEKLAILGMSLGVNEAWLRGFDVPMYCDIGDLEVAARVSNILQPPEIYRVSHMGQIACGFPTLAEQNIETHDEVPVTIKCDFTLLCKGDSMVGAGIKDGDIVYIRAQPEVENGEIAAVMLGEDEVTLKRFRRVGNTILLIPENSSYEPLVFTDGEMDGVRILGKAVGFTRRFEK